MYLPNQSFELTAYSSATSTGKLQPNSTLDFEKMRKHLLSFVTDDDGDQVFIHADLTGVEFLINELNHIKKQLETNECPHSHLFTEDWGSDELSSTKLSDQKDEKNQVHHVKIYGWNEEWKIKHKLVKL